MNQGKIQKIQQITNCVHRSHSFACPGFQAAPLSRRQMIKVGGLGLLGLTLPQFLRAEALKKGPKAKAKSVIFLFQ